MIVAIHQPNYLPWIGYFAKMARADIFVFLDDAQFSKGSFTNRVQIAATEKPSWLTVPVSYNFGDPINAVSTSDSQWASSHRDRLFQTYKSAAAFNAVAPEIEGWLAQPRSANLAASNIELVSDIAKHIGLGVKTVKSSELGILSGSPSERLARIVSHLAPNGTYLSGKGGATYQEPEVFAAHDIHLQISDFQPLPYLRGPNTFVPGLSILDAAFHNGWDAVRAMIEPAK